MPRLLLLLLFILLLTSCKKDNPPPKNIESVTICNQVWMKKNLDVSSYRNGDLIPEVTNMNQWAALTTGAWCYFDNDTANGSIYGKLYNWYAVNDPRGLAPAGWHVPSDAEWDTIANCLGGWEVAGDAMKETGCAHWLCGTDLNVTNSSGWTGLAGGQRRYDSEFVYLFYLSAWWSSTQSDGYNAWNRGLNYINGNLGRADNGNYKYEGLYVRCIRN